MSKHSTIANLIVMPLIASAILLASPALAANSTTNVHTNEKSIMRKMSGGNVLERKKGIVGQVIAISGSIITVKSMDNAEYTVDASKATVMKASEGPDANPSIISLATIGIGDTILVRGMISDKEITAANIFEGKQKKLGKKNHGVRHGRLHR